MKKQRNNRWAFEITNWYKRGERDSGMCFGAREPPRLLRVHAIEQTDVNTETCPSRDSCKPAAKNLSLPTPPEAKIHGNM